MVRGREHSPADIEIAWGPAPLNLLFFEALVLVVAMLAAYFEPVVPARMLLRSLLWSLPFTFAVLTWFYSVFFAWGAFALLAAMYCWRFRDDSGGRPLWDVLAGTHVITTDYEGPDRPYSGAP